MTYNVVVEVAQAQLLAAVRVTVPAGQVGRAWKPALDQVWAFLRANPDLRHGHNLFLYHHLSRAGEPMEVDFGVQVSQRFDPTGNVRCIETPSGEVARTLHVGPYDQIGAAHAAIHTWCVAHQRAIGAASWETCGDHNDEPSLLETAITYLLA